MFRSDRTRTPCKVTRNGHANALNASRPAWLFDLQEVSVYEGGGCKAKVFRSMQFLHGNSAARSIRIEMRCGDARSAKQRQRSEVPSAALNASLRFGQRARRSRRALPPRSLLYWFWFGGFCFGRLCS